MLCHFVLTMGSCQFCDIRSVKSSAGGKTARPAIPLACIAQRHTRSIICLLATSVLHPGLAIVLHHL